MISDKLPESFCNEMKTLLQDEFPDYLKAMDQKPYRGLRVNRNKISVERFLEIFPYELEKVPWTDNGFYIVDDEAPVSKHPFYHAGLYYLQEPSAMSPAAFLPVHSDDVVLDLCAAPGGKATELSSKAGFLLANDISASRAASLLKNLELSGAANFAVTTETPENLSVAYPEFFDKILVDAPCSGEGMFRKDPSLIRSYQEKGPEEYHPIQIQILNSAYRMLKEGGMLLYSTCTFSEKEDEDVILEFLKSHDDMKLIPFANRYPDFAPGRKGLDAAARLFPHRICGEGHFMALLQKDSDENAQHEMNESIRNTASSKRNGHNDSLDLYFIPNSMDGTFYRKNDQDYLLPHGFELRNRIRYLRTGLLLGEEKNNKAKFSQAYAMCLKPSEWELSLNLDPEDDRVIRYLKGETIFITEDEQARLNEFNVKNKDIIICVLDYPLGFGKRNNLSIKNGLAKNYRLL